MYNIQLPLDISMEFIKKTKKIDLYNLIRMDFIFF